MTAHDDRARPLQNGAVSPFSAAPTSGGRAPSYDRIARLRDFVLREVQSDPGVYVEVVVAKALVFDSTATRDDVAAAVRGLVRNGDIKNSYARLWPTRAYADPESSRNGGAKR